MTESKNKSNGRARKPQRERAAASRMQRDPGPADLERATLSLHSSLGYLVRQIKAHTDNGGAWGETWGTIQMSQRRGTRRSASRLTGTELAIRAYAERTTLEDKRLFLGWSLADLAFDTARAKITPEDAVSEAALLRADGVLGWVHPDEPFTPQDEHVANVREALTSARTGWAKFRGVYNELAWNADVWPSPDTARSKRGQLAKMYEARAKKCD